MCEPLLHSGSLSIADLIVYGWTLFSTSWLLAWFLREWTR